MSKRILVVDNNKDILTILSALLSIDSYQVFTANDATSALRKLLTSRPDLVILDVKLPGVSGLEVCRTIKGSDTFYSTPVVMISNNYGPDFSLRLDCINAGAEDLLIKPVNPIIFLDKVKIHLKKKKPSVPAA